MLLVAGLGQSSVFTRTGERRLWVLGADEAMLWELHNMALGSRTTANLLADRFALSPEQAQSLLNAHLHKWRSAGLLEDVSPAGDCPNLAPLEELIQFPAPVSAHADETDLLLSVAQRTVILRIDDAALRTRMRRLLIQLRIARCEIGDDSRCELMEYTGEGENWQLHVNGATMADGKSHDEAIVSIFRLLGEFGCRTAERLLVVHGAGLVSPDGCCFLMAGTGGSGKTTLTVALEADGFSLLSDDVVPIDQDGAAVGLGLPACIKRGSWDVLQPFRPDLALMMETSRFGETVRYLPPRHAVVSGPCLPRLLLFPSYKPDQVPTSRFLTPEEALQRLVAADAVIRTLTQAKLENLCRWISSMPAYSVQYPDLRSGIAMVQRRLEQVA